MIELRRTNSSNFEFRELILELDNELWTRYNTLQTTYNQFNIIASLETVIVAYQSEQPVGCGCFREYSSDTVEIKRMYVKPELRGKGISKQVLHALEQWAAELGYKTALLETGKGQPEASGLFIKYGYKQIENYGQYHKMTSSLCFEKKLIP